MGAIVIERGSAAQSEASWTAGMTHLAERKAEVEKVAPVVDRIDDAYCRLLARVERSGRYTSADARDARMAEIDARLARKPANDFYDRLVDRLCDAELALLRMPAPHAEAALWKVERLWPAGDTIWNDDREVQVHADLRALLLGGRD